MSLTFAIHIKLEHWKLKVHVSAKTWVQLLRVVNIPKNIVTFEQMKVNVTHI